MESAAKTSQAISCPERVSIVEFCPYTDSGPSLLASAGESFVHLNTLHFPQFEPEIDEFYSENLVNVRHSSSVACLSWCPQTSITHHPLNVTFCTGGGDKQLRLVTIDYKKQASVKILGEHKSYINDVAVDPFIGSQVASVGDDKKLRIWDADMAREQCTFSLQSPGTSVRWNPSEQGKLMVSEQNGRIRFYDMLSSKPIMSIEVTSAPLLSADWSSCDPFKVGAVAGNSWYVWDISKSSLPELSDQAFTSVGTSFRWSYIVGGTFGIRGDNQIKVYQLQRHKNPIIHKIKTGGGLSWHRALPVCAGGADLSTLLWSFEML